MFSILLSLCTEFSTVFCFKSSGVLLKSFFANMQHIYWTAPMWKNNFRNRLTWSNNIAQRSSPLSFIHSVNEENLSVVAEECLTVLGKSIRIKK